MGLFRIKERSSCFEWQETTGCQSTQVKRVCSSAGRAAISKVAGRGFKSLRTRNKNLTCVVTVQRASSKVLDKMDLKNTHSTAADKASRKKTVEFVGEVKQELKKIDWTSKDELKAYTKIVLVSTFLFGMAIYFIDLIIQSVLNSFSFIVRFFGG